MKNETKQSINKLKNNINLIIIIVVFLFSIILLIQTLPILSFFKVAWPKYAVYLVLVAFIVLWLFVKFCYSSIRKVIGNARYDLIWSFGSALGFSYCLVGLLLLNLPLLRETALIAIAMLISLFLNLRIKNKNNPEPIYYSDDPQDNDEDLFFGDEPKHFAKKILNNGSPNSIVFGIDAGWGSGKTTFLNGCVEWLQNNCKDDIIIYQFEPLRYKRNSDLFKDFSTGLMKKINESACLPELQKAFSNYLRVVGNVSFKLFGFIELSYNQKLTDSGDAFDELSNVLKSIDKKIIISIDDIDRLTLEEAKTIVNMVKKTFSLPNLTFVLCYSTENINAFESDRKIYQIDIKSEVIKNEVGKSQQFPYGKNTEDIKQNGRVREELDDDIIKDYFEKIINIKKTIVFDRKQLKDYFINLIQKKFPLEIQENLEIKEAIEKLFSDEMFPEVFEYIKDPRKIKRIVNTLISYEHLLKDSHKIDLDLFDLIILILIYLNSPTIFRDIYSFETDGQKEKFSLVFNFSTSDNERAFTNSVFYRKYLTKLSEKEQKLLHLLFNEKKEGDKSVAFNGSGFALKRNLEMALNFIVREDKPKESSQDKYHAKSFEKLLSGETLSSVVATRYPITEGEEGVDEFIKLLRKNIGKIDQNRIEEVINFLVKSVNEYSLVESQRFGSRGIRPNIIYAIIYILDKRGWVDQDGTNFHNDDKESILKIAKWIFAEDDFRGKGIIEMLLNPSNPLLGIHNLLLLRMFSCSNRGSDIFNLNNSLGWHEDISAANSGEPATTIQQMREMTQKIFKEFELQFIANGTNIFETVKNMNREDFFGKYYGYYTKKAKELDIDLGIEESIIKNGYLSYIIYWLSNNTLESGIGCGYYDPDGKNDKSGIRSKMQEYLFGNCFSINQSKQNVVYFINFLLTHFISNHGRKVTFEPSKQELSKYLDLDKLKEYWQVNQDEIKSTIAKLPPDTKVHSYNYYAVYKDDLEPLYKELDSI